MADNISGIKNITIDELKKMGVIKKGSQLKSRKIDKPISLKAVFPDGEYIDTPFRKVFKVKNVYKPETGLGIVNIKDLFEHLDDFNEIFAILGKNDNLKEFQFDQLLFFDVESTGLSSGAGNMVFLIGLGFFDDKKNFIIEQYFIEDYINEKGLLYILDEFFKHRSHLISYNGKSFDFHVLKNRFILSRKFSFLLDNIYHFDLLHASRRMWKSVLNEFNLGELEKNVLKFKRSDEDIPGYLIPEYYKDYLKTHNAKIVEKIFYHNLIDVRSMLGLIIVQIQNLKKILNNEFPEEINYNNMAALLYNIDKKRSLKLLNYAYDNKKIDRDVTLRLLYFHYKREKNINQMINLLEDIKDDIKKFEYFPYLELSKIYEHKLKDYKKAKEILEQASIRIEHLEKMYSITYIKETDDIIKRTDRLNSKCLKK